MASFSLRLSKTPLIHLSKSARAALGAVPNLTGLRTVVWIGAGLLLVALVYLAQSSNAALIARNLSVKQAHIAELQHQNAMLRYEIAQVTSPPNIERRAITIGLSPAKHVVYAALPELKVDMAEVMPAFAPRTTASQTQESNTQPPSPLDQILALFGFGSATDHAEAQSQ